MNAKMKVWIDKTASLGWIDIKLIFWYIKDNFSISFPIYWQLFLTFWQHFAKSFPTFSLHHTSTQHFNNIFQIFCRHFAYNLPTFSLNFPNLFPTPTFLPIFYILPFCLNFPYIFPKFWQNYPTLHPDNFANMNELMYRAQKDLKCVRLCIVR